MKTRAITAFFFTIVMLGSIFLGAYTFSAFYLILSLFGLLEFYKMVATSGISTQKVTGLAGAVAIFLAAISMHLLSFQFKYLLLIIPVLFLVFLVELYRKKDNPFSNIGYTYLGLLYVTIPFCFFYALGFVANINEYSFHFPLAFLLMLWANDTGAYLFGRKLGKHKLFERHSPKKTWEGFLGGVLISLVVAFVLSFYFLEASLFVWAGMAIIISCFGTLGDLVESMLKRSLGVKDSGTFLPGHGGLLDRFDGLLIAAPLVFVYLYLLMN